MIEMVIRNEMYFPIMLIIIKKKRQVTLGGRVMTGNNLNRKTKETVTSMGTTRR
jgi:hypothetical protein